MNDNENLVSEAAKAIALAFRENIYRGAVECAVWQKANGYNFMKDVLELLRETEGWE